MAKYNVKAISAVSLIVPIVLAGCVERELTCPAQDVSFRIVDVHLIS
jgi:hypothetical protein